MVSSEDTGAEHDDQHDAQGEPDRHVPGASGRRLASRNDDLPRGLSCPPPNGPTVAPTTCEMFTTSGPSRRAARLGGQLRRRGIQVGQVVTQAQR
jgi:hypothetical protein